MQSHPQSYNFVAGIGGRDVSKADIEEMFMDLLKAAKGEKIGRVKFINMGVEING
jgi:pyruvate ferredoxin oxidoreductase alpha subunit